MAKFEMEGKFPKRIGDFVLYRWEDKIVIKALSGFTSDAIRTQAKYELTRNNASEFGRVSSLCKQIRLALFAILPKQNNLAVVNNLTKKMRQVLEHDTTNARGERQLANALATEEGREMLTGYDFNPDTPLKLDCTIHENSLIVKTENIQLPKGINHIGFRLHQLVFDFTTGESMLESGEWMIDNENVVLDVPDLGKVNGVRFVILEAGFYYDSNEILSDDCGKSVLIL